MFIYLLVKIRKNIFLIIKIFIQGKVLELKKINKLINNLKKIKKC